LAGLSLSKTRASLTSVERSLALDGVRLDPVRFNLSMGRLSLTAVERSVISDRSKLEMDRLSLSGVRLSLTRVEERQTPVKWTPVTVEPRLSVAGQSLSTVRPSLAPVE
jgi:hypothetical protein